jgi:hypothetical protein
MLIIHTSVQMSVAVAGLFMVQVQIECYHPAFIQEVAGLNPGPQTTVLIGVPWFFSVP